MDDTSQKVTTLTIVAKIALEIIKRVVTQAIKNVIPNC